MGTGDITLTEAARRLSTSVVTLRRHIRTLKVKAKQIGNFKFLTARQFASIQRWDETHRRKPMVRQRPRTGEMTLVEAGRRLNLSQTTLRARIALLGIATESWGRIKILTEDQLGDIRAWDKKNKGRHAVNHQD